MSEKDEIWRPVPSQPEILVSSAGRVMVAPYEAEMPGGGKRHYGGYPHYGVDGDQGRKQLYYKGRCYRIHLLIAEAFLGPKPFDGAVVMHLNENNQDNRADNLRWGTQKENLNAPNYLRKLSNRRRGTPRSSLTEKDVRAIKYGAGSCKDLAERYGVSPSSISNIRAGRSWGHV